tara:strand:- start:116 stop:340 length:225 start_codon:yes stop_codon:yes gene_type:complete
MKISFGKRRLDLLTTFPVSRTVLMITPLGGKPRLVEDKYLIKISLAVLSNNLLLILCQGIVADLFGVLGSILNV